MILNLSRESLLEILESLNIEISGETGRDFIAYCPFHLNRDTAALNISKESPYMWRCWNTACGVSGTLIRLVEVTSDMTPMQALRFLYKYQNDTTPLKALLERNEEAPYEPWPESTLQNLPAIAYTNMDAKNYMLERGYSPETMWHFDLRYSEKKDRIVIPVRDVDFKLVGFSGRAIRDDQEPKYWDKGLPKRHILFHQEHAKQHEDVIVVEGPLDVMKVYQAGYENVVAIFGGGFSKFQAERLTRGFRSCIIFTDNPDRDEAGAALAHKIGGAMRKAGKETYIARYAENVKDPGEMSEAKIKESIENCESLLRYRLRLGGRL